MLGDSVGKSSSTFYQAKRITKGRQKMKTVFSWLFLSGFGFAGYNWGARSFVPRLPILSLGVCAGIAACVMIGLIVTGKNGK